MARQMAENEASLSHATFCRMRFVVGFVGSDQARMGFIALLLFQQRFFTVSGRAMYFPRPAL